MTLTRATLGKLSKRKTKDVEIDGQQVRIQKPTPLEYSKYQMSLVNTKGEPDIRLFADAILQLTARMWIDDEGKRLFEDKELNELANIDLDFYQKLSAECQKFASPEASTAVGESVTTTGSGSPAESALNSE